VLTRKLYPLAPCPNPRITAMQPSSQFRIGPLSATAKRASGPVRGLFVFAALLLAFTPALRAQNDFQGDSQGELRSGSQGESASAASSESSNDPKVDLTVDPRMDLRIDPQSHHEISLTVAEQYLFAAANQERAALGLSALRFDPVLTEASVLHAREMADHATISHQFDNEPDLADRGANAGVHFSLISENVGEAPTSVIIHDLWMHSPGHRANLLDPEVDSIGIAVVDRDGQLYAVEDFASIVQTLPLNEQEQAVASIIAQSGVPVADTTAEARVTCTMSTGYAGRRPWYILRYTASSLNEIPTQLKAHLASGKYHQAVVGACPAHDRGPFTSYNIAVLLYP
jgi:uncharacterized protein YkwD